MQAVVLVVGVDHNWLKTKKEMDSSAVMEKMMTDSSHNLPLSLSLSDSTEMQLTDSLSPLLKLTTRMEEVLTLGSLHQHMDEMKENQQVSLSHFSLGSRQKKEMEVLW